MTRRPGPVLGIAAALALGAATGAAPAAAQSVSSRVVAYSGMPAPGASPATFDNFNYPAIAPNGEIVFRGRTTGSNGYGLWRETNPGSGSRILALVEREGTASPVLGFNFAGFPGAPTINLPGNFAFKTHIQSGSTFQDTLWVEKPAPGGLALVAREGFPAPGVPGANFGAIFANNLYDPLLLDDSGRALFGGLVTGGGVTAANDAGLWFYDGNAATLVAREGDPIPGAPAGRFYIDTFQPASAGVLAGGVFVFFGTDGDPITPIRGLYSNHSGTVQSLVQEGAGGSSIGLGGDEKLTQIVSFRINKNHQVAFSGIVEHDDGVNPVFLFRAVWISDPQGNFQLAARSDQQPPDFRVPDVTVFNDRGEVFGVDQAGKLDKVTTGGLTVVARAGDPAPGTAAGVKLGGLGGLAANAAGQIAFTAGLTGPGVNTTNDAGLWAMDGGFQLVKVAREGDAIEAPAGSPRTIISIEFALGAGSGQPRSMSDQGDVLWKGSVVGLPNGSQIIAVTGVGSPPPPPTLVGLEAVQVVQNWLNTVVLIDGKKTFVRAHLKSASPMKFVGQLRGFDAAQAELPGSPLAPANPGGYVNIDSTSDQKRNRLGAGLYFELPEEWTTGTVRLSLESSSPVSLLCEEAAGPVAGDCQAVVTFIPFHTPRVEFLGIPWLDGTIVRSAGVDLAADLARRTLLVFPSKSVEWSFRQSGLFFPQLPEVEAVLPLLDYIRLQSHAGTRFVYGVIPSEKTVGVLGIAQLGAFVGVGHTPADPKKVPGRQTHTHEMAHGADLKHAVLDTLGKNEIGQLRGACGEVASPTTGNFSHWFTIGGVPRPTLGPFDQGPNKLVYGLDTDLMEVADPLKVFELMSYCSHPRLDLWPSDVTHDLLTYLIDSLFEPKAPVAVGDHFLVRGKVRRDASSVELAPFGTLLQAEAPAAPPAGEYLLRLRNGAGALLQQIPFEPTAMEPFGLGGDPGLGSFLIGVPADPAIRKVEILHGGFVLASRAASANAPTVQVTSPNGGESFSGPTVDLQWTGSDSDGDPLTYLVQYSRDDGATWTALGADLKATSLQIPRSSLPATTQGRLRVQASDGFRTAFDASNGAFTVSNNPPFVALSDPDEGRLFSGDQLVFFESLSFDPEDGNLSGSSLAWSSDLDGALGTGVGFSRQASTLSPGTHVITVTATDGQGAQATDTTTIRVATAAPDPLTDLAVAILDPAPPVLVGSSAAYTIQAENKGPEAASGVGLTLSATLDPAGPAGPGPATILSVSGSGWSCTPGSGSASCTRSAFDALVDSPVTVIVAAPQVGALNVTAQISGAEEDAATGNNTEHRTTAVELPSADLSVTKTHGPPTPLVGHDLTYTITVNNKGPAPATGVTIEDTLPAGVTFVSTAVSQGTCSGTSVVTCNLGSLASGGQATVTIVGKPASAGAVTNSVTVSSGESDPAPSDNTASDTATVVAGNGAFGMDIAQVFSGSAAAPDAQYVMLQMWTDGQGAVGGHEIAVSDFDGTPLGTFTFPAAATLANAQSQDTVLIATAEAQSLFGATADLTMTPVAPGGGAKFCWAGTSECMSIGKYLGPPTGAGNPFAVAELGGLAVTRKLDIAGNPAALDALDDTNDSAHDFVLATPAPRNNAGESGTPPASTCGNNVLEGLEDCDDGGAVSGDGCSSFCFREPAPVVPAGLQADPAAGAASDGNGVLEPGETAPLKASWRNDAAAPAETRGAAALFTGPAGTTYSILDGLADYGEIAPGGTSTCVADCFQLRLSPAAGSRPEARPSTHWDASIDEVVSGGGRTRRSLHIGDSFTDVPRSYLFYRRVETVLHHGITVGCTGTTYCPNDKVRRDQMGIFLARAIARGGANIPQSGTVGSSPYHCALGGVSLFSDVAPTDSTCRAIHYIAAKNVTGGCGGGAFCVSSNVTRAEMGLFVARGLVAPAGGAAVPLTYGPDPVTGRSYSCAAGSPNLNFTDVTPADSFCRHVHYLWAKGIVSGCSATQYCIAGDVTRGEMARFLSTAFAPNLYGP